MYSYRRYNRILALAVLPLVAVLVITSFFMEPLDGPMTRVGGYREHLYGWNKPQTYFEPPLFETRSGGYERYADVVVLGDSFSNDRAVGWPNYLVGLTGYRVDVFHYNDGGAARLLDSPLFAQHPPRLFVVQTIENHLLDRFGGPPPADCDRPTPALDARHPYAPVPIDPKVRHRDSRRAVFDLNLAADYLSKMVPRELFGMDVTDTRRFRLTREGMFSSRETRDLLVYRDDLKKADWDAAALARIRCNLRALQNRVQANGETFFAVMVVPDKLSAYAHYLQETRYADLGVITALRADPQLHVLPLQANLMHAIDQGVVDVYSPNNTHWGSVGYRMAARTLLDYATDRGVLEPAP